MKSRNIGSPCASFNRLDQDRPSNTSDSSRGTSVPDSPSDSTLSSLIESGASARHRLTRSMESMESTTATGPLPSPRGRLMRVLSSLCGKEGLDHLALIQSTGVEPLHVGESIGRDVAQSTRKATPARRRWTACLRKPATDAAFLEDLESVLLNSPTPSAPPPALARVSERLKSS